MKTIYIEGTSETDNGSLRKAFSLLLAKDLANEMPHIVMGDGKNQTIDKFHSTPLKPNEVRFLLFDSDAPNPNKEQICLEINAAKQNRKLDATLENTFLMIQEVEAWILSQPEVLTNVGVSMKKVNIPNVEEIEKPSERLASLYKHSNKVYTKVGEFVKVFPKLDANKLKEDSSEYRKMIQALKNK